jgi:AraC-like DNA-binding protein
MPVHALSDAVVDLNTAFGPTGMALEAALYDDRDSLGAQAARLDQFFLARLRPDKAHPLVAAMSAALARDPRASVLAISDQFGYSIRSMDRLFNAVLGFSPKTYARVLRLGAALAALSADDVRPLAEIATASGYYDQAHFTHEFRDFVGATPSAYRALLYARREQPPPNLVQFLQDSRAVP